jgi:hypothetical protein
LCFCNNINAQEEIRDLKKLNSKKKPELDSVDWKHSGVFILNVNQSSQSNWGTGGENFMLGINTILNRSVHHKKGKFFFDGYVDLELGLVFATSYKEFRKTTDRFDLTLDMEHTIDDSEHFSYGMLVNVNTQLFTGREYVSDFHEKISNFLTPGKALISLGVEYRNIKPHTYFTAFVSPATIRWVTKIDQEFYPKNKFGVDSLDKVYTELGAYLSMHYNIKFTRNVSLLTRVDLFSNYQKGFDHIDMLMNNVATFGISKWFAASLMLDLLYDYDTKSQLQIQQITGIGLKLNL